MVAVSHQPPHETKKTLLEAGTYKQNPGFVFNDVKKVHNGLSLVGFLHTNEASGETLETEITTNSETGTHT